MACLDAVIKAQHCGYEVTEMPRHVSLLRSSRVAPVRQRNKFIPGTSQPHALHAERKAMSKEQSCSSLNIQRV